MTIGDKASTKMEKWTWLIKIVVIHNRASCEIGQYKGMLVILGQCDHVLPRDKSQKSSKWNRKGKDRLIPT